MPKVMGNSGVLRCLARNIIYRPTKSGRYLCDAHCDRKCVPLGKLDLCLAFRRIIDNEVRITNA
jgi:hypothetical protein